MYYVVHRLVQHNCVRVAVSDVLFHAKVSHGECGSTETEI